MGVEGPAFGLAEVEGCLAAFESTRDAMARARLLTAVAATACATTGADTTTNAFFLETINDSLVVVKRYIFGRAFGWLQVGERNNWRHCRGVQSLSYA